MDSTVLIIALVVLMPIGVVWALAKSAALRGPAPRPESKRPVGSLVTEALPEERPDEDDVDDGPGWRIDSEPPEPDPAIERDSTRRDQER